MDCPFFGMPSSSISVPMVMSTCIVNIVPSLSFQFVIEDLLVFVPKSRCPPIQCSVLLVVEVRYYHAHLLWGFGTKLYFHHNGRIRGVVEIPDVSHILQSIDQHVDDTDYRRYALG